MVAWFWLLLLLLLFWPQYSIARKEKLCYARQNT